MKKLNGGKSIQKIILGAVVALSVCVFSASSAAAEMREGKWSMTMVTKAAGMEEAAAEAQAAMQNMSPEEQAMMQQVMGGAGMNVSMAGGGMKTTITRCVTSAAPVPQMDTQEDCQTKHSIQGNTVHFETVCKDSISTGDITYEQDSMKGTIRSRATSSGGHDATIEMSGQYLGPCD